MRPTRHCVERSMAKQSGSPNTEFKPSKSVTPAHYAQSKLAFRAPLNRRRSLKQDPAQVLEKLLDERVTIDGVTTTKRDVIVGNWIGLAGGVDHAAVSMLEKFLGRQRDLRMDEE